MIYIYVHGFGSKGDINNPKVKQLAEIGEAMVVEYDSKADAHTIEKDLVNQLKPHALSNEDICLVGCSLGGYWASILGNHFNIPFVALNPCIDPMISLAKYGLDDDVLRSYILPFANSHQAPGMIALAMDDDVIDPQITLDAYYHLYQFDVAKSGGHRYENLEKILVDIHHFSNNALNLN